METKAGPVPISAQMVAKYHLQKGTHAPFSGGRIVGEGGDFTRKPVKKTDRPPLPAASQTDGGAEIQPGVILTTSEILDFAHGEDSSTGG